MVERLIGEIWGQVIWVLRGDKELCVDQMASFKAAASKAYS